MDSTILLSIAEFILGAVAGGIAWDTIKLGAKSSFKEYFTKKKYFADGQQAEAFLEKIGTAESYNTKNPYDDARSIYQKMTGKLADESFQHEFEGWIKKNADLFTQAKGPIEYANIIIHDLKIQDNASPTFIGTQHNYK
jgi:hypothetical protein